MTTNVTAKQNEVKSIIKQSASWYNPYSFEGKEVDSIRFYNESGEIVSINWFGSNNDYPELNLPFEIRRAIKLNFTKKDAFYMKAKDCSYASRVDIYIHESLLNLQNLGEKRTDYDTSIQYRTEYTISVQASKKQVQFDKKLDKAFYTVSDIEQRDITFYGNYHFEKNDEGKRLQNIMTIAKECGLNWSEYDIQNLEKRFELKIKNLQSLPQ